MKVAAFECRGFQAESGHLLRRTPEASIDQREGLVMEDRKRVGMVEVLGAQPLVEDMQVPDFQGRALPQEVGAVVPAIEPVGLPSITQRVLRGDDGRRRGHGIAFPEPAAGLREGLDTDFPFLLQPGDLLRLIDESLLHQPPGEGVLLAHLDIVEAQVRLFGEHPEEPVHPRRKSSAQFIDGFQGDDALDRPAHAGFILIDGIASQHPEDGKVDAALGGLGRHVSVLPAGIIGAVPVTSPEGISVRTHLVPAVARGFDTVFVAQVGQRSGLDEPGSDGFRPASEDFLELVHIDIDQMLPFRLGIANRKAYVRVPVPRIASPPTIAGGLDVRLRDFPPGADFAAPLHLFLHQGLVGRVDQGVVLQQVRSRKPLAPKVFRLGKDRLVEDLFGYFIVTGFRVADEIDDVDDARTVLGSPLRRLAARQKGGDDGQWKNSRDIHAVVNVLSV